MKSAIEIANTAELLPIMFKRKLDFQQMQFAIGAIIGSRTPNSPAA